MHVNGEELYERHVVGDHGHIDVWWSNKANEVTFDWVKNRLESTSESFYYNNRSRPGSPMPDGTTRRHSRQANGPLSCYSVMLEK
jgi:hypothetical protein